MDLLRGFVVYLGPESGDDRTLKRIVKGGNHALHVEAAQKAHAAGMRVSMIVLLGIGASVLARLLADGPTDAELAQAKSVLRAGFVRGIERIGGFGGKADVLARCEVLHGDPGCFRNSQQRIADATAQDLRAVGREWLSTGDHVLTVVQGKRTILPEDPAVTPEPFNLPEPDSRYTTSAPAVDRSLGVPVTGEFPDLKFPELQRARLGNGTTVILAERRDVPVVQLSYEFPGGFSADQDRTLGTSSFTMAMLDEGAGDLGPLAFADRAEALGAQLRAGLIHAGECRSEEQDEPGNLLRTNPSYVRVRAGGGEHGGSLRRRDALLGA